MGAQGRDLALIATQSYTLRRFLDKVSLGSSSLADKLLSFAW
jgi:hypothetical protein